MQFEAGKAYRTFDGSKAEIWKNEDGFLWGRILILKKGKWHPAKWTLAGHATPFLWPEWALVAPWDDQPFMTLSWREDQGPIHWFDIAAHAGVTALGCYLHPLFGVLVAVLVILREVKQRRDKGQPMRRMFTSLQVLLEWVPSVVIAAVALLIGMSAPAAAKINTKIEKVVFYDPGGVIGTRLREIDRLRAEGKRVRIMGRCESACTLYLIMPNTCIGQGADFRFHQAWDHRRQRADSATKLMFMLYPKRIQDWITSKGGLGPDFIWLRGDEMRKLVRACK